MEIIRQDVASDWGWGAHRHKLVLLAPETNNKAVHNQTVEHLSPFIHLNFRYLCVSVIYFVDALLRQVRRCQKTIKAH